MGNRCPTCHSENPETQRFCGGCGTPLSAFQAQPPAVTETLDLPIRELATGSTFAGRYQVIEELGHGGMGRVYKVQDAKIGEKIALKLIRPEAGLDKKTIERFSNELKLARKIRHKNVCQMFDLGEDRGTRYITMEYVHGEDLKQLIRKVGRLSPGQAITIARQVCEGLEEAHRLGVIHRDLKPQNIMVDEDGNSRIMDFGIARSLSGKSITGAGVMIGTPEYMSPEQVEGKDVDLRSDIYSLGVILFEMLTGRVPFEGDTPFAVGVKHKSEPPRDPRELNAQIPGDLAQVVLRCLAKDREQRYGNAGELRAELERVEQGIPTTERILPSKKALTSREITVKFNLKKLLVPAFVVVLAVAAALFFVLRGRGPGLDPKRVVVAVFENQTGDPKFDTVGRLAADWIAQGLQQTGLVTVAPVPAERGAEAGLNGPRRLRDIAREAGAGTVVSGTVYRQGGDLRFQARLTAEPASQLLVALDPVTGPAEDPTKPIEFLRQKVMGALAALYDQALQPFIGAGVQPPTYEAYLALTEGWKLFMRREFKNALVPLARASALDPTFYFPLVSRAFALINLGQSAEAEAAAWELEKVKDRLSPIERAYFENLEAWQRGDNQAAYRASSSIASLLPSDHSFYELGLDALRINRPGEAIEALKKCDPAKDFLKGWTPYWEVLTSAYHMLGDYKRELEEARRGRIQYPDEAPVLECEIRALAALGRIDEVGKKIDESFSLPPVPNMDFGSIMRRAGAELRSHGYREASLKVLDRAIQWYRGRPQDEARTEARRSGLGRALYYADRWDEAGRIFEELTKEFPDNEDYLGYCGTVAARKGEKEKATQVSEQLAGLKKPYLFGNDVYWRACIASILGEKETAMSLLREALAKGSNYEPLFDDLDLEPLRDYQPFKELIKPKG